MFKQCLRGGFGDERASLLAACKGRSKINIKMVLSTNYNVRNVENVYVDTKQKPK